MAFALRRPFAVSAALKATFKSSSAPFRAFSHASPQSKLLQPTSILSKTSQNAFTSAFRQSSRRSYMQQNYSVPNNSGDVKAKLVYGAALFGGTVVVINLLFNRETREDGGMRPYERAYLNETFMHTGLGVGIIAVAARALHTSGWSVRLMTMNPYVVLGVGLVGSIGTMMATFATPPEQYVQKYACWTGFNLCQAALLSPLMFMSPAILFRAGLYTVGMMGSISFVAATAKTDKYLYLGAPLMGGLAVVALSGLAPLVLPATAMRTLMWTENIWLYGGLAVFGGLTLYDIQKILQHSRLAERGLAKRDVVNEAVSLELDFINIFVRMVQIMGMQRRK